MSMMGFFGQAVSPQWNRPSRVQSLLCFVCASIKIIGKGGDFKRARVWISWRLSWSDRRLSLNFCFSKSVSQRKKEDAIWLNNRVRPLKVRNTW